MFKKEDLKLLARYHSCKTRRCADKSAIKKVFQNCKGNECKGNSKYMQNSLKEYITCRNTLCANERKKVHTMFRTKRKKYNHRYIECKKKCPNKELLDEDPVYEKQLKECDNYMPKTTNVSKIFTSVPWRECVSKIKRTSTYKIAKKKYNKCLKKACHKHSDSLYKFDIQNIKLLKDSNYKPLFIFDFDEPDINNSVIH